MSTTNNTPITSATPVTRNSPRSVNLPTLVVHSPVHREHKRRNSEPASPITPTTPYHTDNTTTFYILHWIPIVYTRSLESSSRLA
ncbi:hypothetical protein V865_008146 [Kwoniella europaea PYCC6329]|uniref:Uncharacterized protein n=1 Tax=Kwoniella europaea PYCC6329 TaxID=1423913 RepID=A0AAX4KX94_9TREE